MKIKPEAQLKACRFQFQRLLKMNELLCQALNVAKDGLSAYHSLGDKVADETLKEIEKIEAQIE